MRVVAYVDGFNLYHAIHDLKQNHLKWMDLWAICQSFAPLPDCQLTQVYYFSAFATWRKNSFARHRALVKALEATGVTPVMGRFKEKNRECFRCKHSWKDHEEKETDVNIALHLLRGAVQDHYDRALLVSGDSDLTPAVRAVKEVSPQKDVRIISPVGRGLSMDLVHAAGGKEHGSRMKPIHLERSLLPERVCGSDGKLVSLRPTEYNP